MKKTKMSLHFFNESNKQDGRLQFMVTELSSPHPDSLLELIMILHGNNWLNPLMLGPLKYSLEFLFPATEKQY